MRVWQWVLAFWGSLLALFGAWVMVCWVNARHWCEEDEEEDEQW